MTATNDAPVLPAPPADPVTLKCQCADLWSHPAAQLLLGRTLRPGGAELTAELLDRAGLAPGSTVLDVGCGPGATLELLAAAGLRGVGVDYSAAAVAAGAEGGLAGVAGDAERLPIGDRTVDAALIECVVSALPDKDGAVAELARVIRADGCLLLSDMTLAESFPEPLDSALAWVACAGGALRADGYEELLRAHGFVVEAVEDRSQDLLAMVAKARRRLALFRGASGVGLLPPLDDFVGPDLSSLARAVLGHGDLEAGGREILTQVADSVRRGAMGYAALVARRR